MATAKKPSAARTSKRQAKRKPSPKPIPLRVDGDQLVQFLIRAGLDPAKLDLGSILGSQGSLDIMELESRLRAAGTAKSMEWHIGGSVSLG